MSDFNIESLGEGSHRWYFFAKKLRYLASGSNPIQDKIDEIMSFYPVAKGMFIWQVAALSLFILHMPDMCAGKPFIVVNDGVICCARFFFFLYLVPMTVCAVFETLLYSKI